MLGEVEAEAALHAEEIFIDTGKIAVVGAHDFVISNAQGGFAAVRTVRADRGDILHFPRAGLVAVGAAGQRSDRADIDAHAALFALEVVFAIGDNDAVGAAHSDTQRFDVH